MEKIIDIIIRILKAIVPQGVICAVTYIGCYLCVKGINLLTGVGTQATGNGDISFMQMMPAAFIFLVAIVCFLISKKIVSHERKALQQRHQIENAEKYNALVDKYITIVDKTDDPSTKNDLIRAIGQTIYMTNENDD